MQVFIFFQLNKEIMEPLTGSQKSILTDTYTSRYNAYTAKDDLFKKLTLYGKKNYYILRTILTHVRKILKENQNSYVGFLTLEPLVDDEIKTANLRHLSMEDIYKKLWTVIIQRGRNKWGELYIKFRVYK